MNFKDLEKELPILLGWKIHSLNRVYKRISFEDLRTHDECHEEIYLAYTPSGDDNLLLLIWGDNKDSIIKKMNGELGFILQDGLLIDSVIPLCHEDISRIIEFYDQRFKVCMTN